MTRRVVDLTGQTFGSLLVIHQIASDPGAPISWLCRCICGRPHTARGGNLKSGRTTRCSGCRSGEPQEIPAAALDDPAPPVTVVPAFTIECHYRELGAKGGFAMALSKSGQCLARTDFYIPGHAGFHKFTLKGSPTTHLLVKHLMDHMAAQEWIKPLPVDGNRGRWTRITKVAILVHSLSPAQVMRDRAIFAARAQPNSIGPLPPPTKAAKAVKKRASYIGPDGRRYYVSNTTQRVPASEVVPLVPHP